LTGRSLKTVKPFTKKLLLPIMFLGQQSTAVAPEI